MPVEGLEIIFLGAIVLAPVVYSVALLATSLIINLALYAGARLLGGKGAFLAQWFATGWLFVPLSPLLAILAASIGFIPLAIAANWRVDYPLTLPGTAMLALIVAYIAYILAKAVKAVHGLPTRKVLLLSALVTLAWAAPYFMTFEANTCSMQCLALDSAASITGNAQWCEQIPREQIRKQCGQRLALTSNDPDSCVKDDFECITDLADKNRNPDLCDRIAQANHKGSCLDTFVTKSTPASFCNRFDKSEQIYTPKDCYMKLLQWANSTAPCDSLNGRPRDECQWEWAEEKQDAKECAAIRDNTTKRECFDELYWSLRNSFQCYKEQDARARLDCYVALATQNTVQTPDSCAGIKADREYEEQIEKNRCYLRQALDGETGACTRLLDPYSRSDCFLQVAQKQKNPSLCGVIREDEGTRYSCYASLAGITGNVDACIGKMAPLTENDCYYYVANATGNVTLCQTIKDFGMKNGCILTVAVTLKDNTLCTQIESDYDRSRCYEWVNR